MTVKEKRALRRKVFQTQSKIKKSIYQKRLLSQGIDAKNHKMLERNKKMLSDEITRSKVKMTNL